MKIIYNENEKERIEEWYPNSRIKVFDENDPERVYSISFKVTNPALAQHIFTGMLYNQLEDFDLGIKLTAINFDVIQDKDNVKERLHKMIEEII